MKLTIGILILFLLAILIYSFVQTSVYPAACGDCNVILISVDSLRADHLGAYGYYRDTTPNLDRIAKNSILFKNYISQAFLTAIVEMSVHTSKYPSSSNFVGRGYSLDDSTLLLSQILKKNGFKTAAFISSPEFGSWYTAFNKGFDVYDYDDESFRGTPNNKVFDWLDTLRNERFFLWVTDGEAHAPFARFVNESSLTKYDPPGYNGVFKDESLATLRVLRRIYNNTYYLDNGTVVPISQKDIDYIIGRYDIGIAGADQFIGRLFAKLDELDLMKKTIIVISSEHGEAFGEHGYVGHYDIYDTEIHTPLIMVIPNFGPKQITTQVQSIDILPTILDYANITIPSQADGKSLIPLIEGNASDDFNKYVYVERIPLFEYFLQERDLAVNNGTDVVAGLNITTEDFAVRTNDWKLIYRESHDVLENISWYRNLTGKDIEFPVFELYNIKNDPYEKNNLIDKEPKVAEELKQKLFIWLSQINQTRQKRQIELSVINTSQEILPYP